jgi:hypothetical protein
VAAAHQSVDDVPMPDEVDLHQVWTVGDTGGREEGVDGSADLLEGVVNRRRVPKVHLDPAAEAGVDRRVVHVDDLGSERADDLGRRGAHAGGTSDYQRPLAVVAELLDTSHFYPLLGCLP